MAHFLTTLTLVSGLLGFEIIGTNDEVMIQVVCQPDEANVVVPQMQAHFPELKLALGAQRAFRPLAG